MSYVIWLRNLELRNSSRFTAALTAALQLASGDKEIGVSFKASPFPLVAFPCLIFIMLPPHPGISCKAICDQDKANSDEITNGPSASTFSRCRSKLDILAMFCRKWMWKQHGFQPFWVSLCTLYEILATVTITVLFCDGKYIYQQLLLTYAKCKVNVYWVLWVSMDLKILSLNFEHHSIYHPPFGLGLEHLEWKS